jgi:hypothetical protein
LFELNDGSLNLITLINYIFVKKYVWPWDKWYFNRQFKHHHVK